jgi:hypothetical protein
MKKYISLALLLLYCSTLLGGNKFAHGVFRSGVIGGGSVVAVLPDLIIGSGQTVVLTNGQSYIYNSISIASTGTLQITNKTGIPEWTSITCNSLTMVAGASIRADRVAYPQDINQSISTVNGTLTSSATAASGGNGRIGNGGIADAGIGAKQGGGGGDSGDGGIQAYYGDPPQYDSLSNLNATNGYIGGGYGGYAVSVLNFPYNAGATNSGNPYNGLWGMHISGVSSQTPGAVGGAGLDIINLGTESQGVEGGGGAGGSGGSSSGSLYIRIINTTSISGGTINVSGQSGGTGGKGGDAYPDAGFVFGGCGGGGGAGGSGGKLVVYYHGTAPTWTINNSGGSGGAGGGYGVAYGAGSSTTSDGAAGLNGASGVTQSASINSF